MRTPLVKGISVVVVAVAAFALYRLRSHAAPTTAVASGATHDVDAGPAIEVGLETMLDHHETYNGRLVVTKGMVLDVTPGEHGTTVVIAEGSRSAICYAAPGATFAKQEWVRVRGQFDDYRIHECVREDGR